MASKANKNREYRLKRILLGALAALLLIQVASRIVTMTPWEDEGFFADPALRLLREGYLGTRSVDPTSAWQSPNQWVHADRYFYYLPPLYEVLLAGWWKLTGFGLFTMRALSGVAGVLLCFASFGVAQRLSPLRWAPYATLAYLATNYYVVSASSTGRQDCLTTAFGMAGLWVYFVLKERGRERAGMLAGHSLIAAATLTHPNGCLYFLPLLYLMWRNGSFRVVNVALAAIPYVLFLSAWALYIRNDPQAFLLQFGTNLSGHRVGGGLNPFRSLVAELGRYYILPTSETSGRAKIILVVPMLLSAALLFLVRDLRRQHRDLAVLMAYFFLAMTYLIGRKWDGYLVNIVPVYGLAIGCVAAYFWSRNWMKVAFALTCLLGLAATFRLAAGMRYQREYAPVVAYVKNLHDKDRVFAAAEFGFGLGFDNVRDDYSLGFGSGIHPKTIIMGEWYDAQMQSSSITRPAIFQSMKETLSECRQVFSAGQYRVFVAR